MEQNRRYDFAPNINSARDRAVVFARYFFQLDQTTQWLGALVPDLDQRFVAFRRRIYQRLQHLPQPILNDQTPPILFELEMHIAAFLRWCHAGAAPQQPAFASFIQWHYVNDATQEGFVRRLIKTEGAFSEWESPQYGDLTGSPTWEKCRRVGPNSKPGGMRPAKP